MMVAALSLSATLCVAHVAVADDAKANDDLDSDFNALIVEDMVKHWDAVKRVPVVGWYLIDPPVKSESESEWTANPDAPLSEWKIEQYEAFYSERFDTAAACEKERATKLARANEMELHAEKQDAKNGKFWQQYAAWLKMVRCIASNDPRLKKK